MKKYTMMRAINRNTAVQKSVQREARYGVFTPDIKRNFSFSDEMKVEKMLKIELNNNIREFLTFTMKRSYHTEVLKNCLNDILSQKDVSEIKINNAIQTQLNFETKQQVTELEKQKREYADRNKSFTKKTVSAKDKVKKRKKTESLVRYESEKARKPRVKR